MQAITGSVHAGNGQSRISETLSFVIIGVGLIVLVGWIAGVDIIKNAIPGSVSMKLSTSISFIFAGLSILAISKSLNRNARPLFSLVVLPSSILVIILFMTTHITAILLSTQNGIDNLFVKEAPDSIFTTSPGRPSVGTVANFVLIIVAGIMTLGNIAIDKKHKLFRGIGLAIGLVAAVALVGYAANVPSLYYFSEPYSTAMAVHTAVLFVLVGAGFWLVPISKTDSGTNRINVAKASVGVAESATPVLPEMWAMLSFIVISVIPILFIGGVIMNNSNVQSEGIGGSIISLAVSAVLSITFFATVSIRAMLR
jgi:hypothetical protein